MGTNEGVRLFDFDDVVIVSEANPTVWPEGQVYPYYFIVDDEPTYERFDTVERCVVEAIAAKYCGIRSAGGTGVDTAAGWFARMIGMYRDA